MKVFFDHIPKTAGTSITSALSVALGEPTSWTNQSHHSAIAAAQQRKLLAGHFWFAPGEYLAPGWYYTSVLRDPIERFVSQYFFNQLAIAGQPWVGKIDKAAGATASLSLTDYLRSDEPLLKASYNNVQTRHFAERVSLDVENLSDTDLFDAAVASLEDYDLVGTVDDLSGFLNILCIENDIRPPKLQMLNANAKRQRTSELEPVLLEQLRVANQVDLRLLAWVRERFDKKKRVASSTELAAQNDTNRSDRKAPAENFSFGTGQVRILSVECEGPQGDAMALRSGDPVRIVVKGAAGIDEPILTTGIAIRDERGEIVYGTNTALMARNISVSAGQAFQVVFVFAANLGLGTFWVTVAFHRGTSHRDGNYEYRNDAAVFRIVEHGAHLFEGRCNLNAAIEVKTPE